MTAAGYMQNSQQSGTPDSEVTLFSYTADVL
jgi:hypothetical protein